MLAYIDGNWDRNPLVRDSARRAMDLFGVKRCMFASNFPVEKHVGWPAARLYAGFRDIASHLAAADQQRLFADTARRAYRVSDVGVGLTFTSTARPAASGRAGDAPLDTELPLSGVRWTVAPTPATVARSLVLGFLIYLLTPGRCEPAPSSETGGWKCRMPS